MFKYVMSLVLAIMLVGCDSADERYEAGYDDGFAAGYNSECESRSTLIEGDWGDADYTRGYNDGDFDGRKQCRSDHN